MKREGPDRGSIGFLEAKSRLLGGSGPRLGPHLGYDVVFVKGE